MELSASSSNCTGTAIVSLLSNGVVGLMNSPFPPLTEGVTAVPTASDATERTNQPIRSVIFITDGGEVSTHY